MAVIVSPSTLLISSQTNTGTNLVERFLEFDFDVSAGTSSGTGSEVGANRLTTLSFSFNVKGLPTATRDLLVADNLVTTAVDEALDAFRGWVTNLSSQPGGIAPNASVDENVNIEKSGSDVRITFSWQSSSTSASANSQHGTLGSAPSSLVHVKIPLGSASLDSSTFSVQATSYGDANFTDPPFTSGIQGSSSPNLVYADQYVAPQLTSMTAKVDGVAASDGPDTGNAFDVRAGQTIEVTFTFSKSIDPTTFNFSNLADLSSVGWLASLGPVSNSNNTSFKAILYPNSYDSWSGDVTLQNLSTIRGTNGLELDTSNPSSPTTLSFAGDTLAPDAPALISGDYAAPGVRLEDAGSRNYSFTDNIVGKAEFQANLWNTDTAQIDFFVDGASTPRSFVHNASTHRFEISGLSDGAHTVQVRAVDSSGNQSSLSNSISFTLDTTAPTVSLVEAVSSPPSSVFSTPVSGEKYFRVKFSEAVHSLDMGDFIVTNADGTAANGTVTIADIRPASWTQNNTLTPSDEYYIKVTGESISTLTLALKPVVAIDSVSPGVPPADLLSSLTSAEVTELTNGVWVRIELENPLPFISQGGSQFMFTSSQSGVTTAYAEKVVAEGSSATGYQTVYAYVKSSSTTQALEVNQLSVSLSDTATETGASVFDIAGNRLFTDPGLDDVSVVNSSTTSQAADPNFLIKPETGPNGFDTLDLLAFGSQPLSIVTDYRQVIVYGATSTENKVYRFENFDRFLVSGSKVEFRGSDVSSEVVRVGNNTSGHDIRMSNLALDETAPETDVVDYSQSSASITLNLSSVTPGGGGWFYSNANKGTLSDTAWSGGVDKVAGVEGVYGSQVADQITGNSAANLLWGAGGNDTLTGGAGNDVLIGGSGAGDSLIGGMGSDVLMDLDGGTLRGSDNKKGASAASERDVFVVRNGASIENYQVARDNAGLAGRAATSANDVILFNLSLGALTSEGKLSAELGNKSGTELQTALSGIQAALDIRVERVQANDDDWQVIATYNGAWSGNSTVELARVVVKDMDATTMPASSVLQKVLLKDYELKLDSKIDGQVFLNTPDVDITALKNDTAIDVAFVLEAVRAGTVREVRNGLMFGDNGLSERIFNPGAGSERIYGSNKRDVYEFLVQDFGKTNGVQNTNAGTDRILDTGGVDEVVFSNITLETISALDFSAARIGRESGNYSLTTNYSQSNGEISNQGSFTWLGHFREGFDMELERIVLSAGGASTVSLDIADVRYLYNSEGLLLSRTPQQVAQAGMDTIMVGGVGVTDAASTFVVEGNLSTDFGTDGQHLYLWDVDGTKDVLNLDAFFISEADAENSVLGGAGTPSSNWILDLDPGAGTKFLELHFMGGDSFSKETLQEMITRANYS